MCGLNFIYSSSRNHNLLTSLACANEKLSHRGPDQLNFHVSNNWGMGHTRLSILDLEKSIQPMHCEEKRFWLVFNGEIYNYKELRESLRHKWNFKTSGDTETILCGLITEGTKFINKLDGMWSFVFWDSKTETLIASRDPFGKKPLYYTTNNRGIAFSSEIPALRALDSSTWREDPNSTLDFFKYGFFLPGKTIFKQVHELLPARFLIWQPGDAPQQHQYWQLPKERSKRLRKEEINEKLKSLMDDAINKRLAADVEVGAFLSGGIDSSLIVALASEKVNKLKTFCVKFSNKGFDESEYARQISSIFSTEHHEFSFDEINPGQITQLIINHFGQPFADPSALPTALISERTASHVKVVLTGDGGDEIFSGYQRYQAQKILEIYRLIPSPLTQSLETALIHVKEPNTHHSKSLLKKLILFSRTAKSFRNKPLYLAPELDTVDLLDLKQDTHYAHSQKEFKAVKMPSAEKTMQKDTEIYLPQDILFKVDRCTMAYGLEARSPLLDKRLAEFAYSIDLKYHRSLFSGKKLLKTNFPKLPSSITRRRKQGFSIPVAEWFKHNLSDELLEIAVQVDSPLSISKLKTALITHKRGEIDLGLQLWGIYTYLKWKESFY